MDAVYSHFSRKNFSSAVRFGFTWHEVFKVVVPWTFKTLGDYYKYVGENQDNDSSFRASEESDFASFDTLHHQRTFQNMMVLIGYESFNGERSIRWRWRGRGISYAASALAGIVLSKVGFNAKEKLDIPTVVQQMSSGVNYVIREVMKEVDSDNSLRVHGLTRAQPLALSLLHFNAYGEILPGVFDENQTPDIVSRLEGLLGHEQNLNFVEEITYVKS